METARGPPYAIFSVPLVDSHPPFSVVEAMKELLKNFLELKHLLDVFRQDKPPDNKKSVTAKVAVLLDADLVRVHGKPGMGLSDCSHTANISIMVPHMGNRIDPWIV